MELPEVAENTLRVASGKQHERSPKIHTIFQSLTLLLESYSSRTEHSGTPKLGLEVQRACTIDGSPHPLPVIYTYGAGVSDYTCTCRPNIHHLLYLL